MSDSPTTSAAGWEVCRETRYPHTCDLAGGHAGPHHCPTCPHDPPASAALTSPITFRNEHAYISIDPGKHNGWATWDEKGDLTGYGTAVGGDNFFPWLYANRATKGYIVEKFTLFPWKNQQAQFSWNDFEVSQMIGAVKFVAFLQGVIVVESPPNIKKMAYKNSGIPVPKNKAISHHWDAVMHGYKYLMDIGVRKVGPL